MIFNSQVFLFIFLPFVLLGFFAIGRYSIRWAGNWLLISSVFFYGWWNCNFVWVLLVSILFNFSAGVALARSRRVNRSAVVDLIFIAAVSGNLLLLAYYKYANFFMENLADLGLADQHSLSILLPLGISFFTFTQIAFLADCRRGLVEDFCFPHYALFVTYFPHLIAGPVLHHKEMMPQFDNKNIYRPHWDCLAIGVTVFSIGLFKKVVLADGIAPFVSPVFSASALGREIGVLEAHCGALAYAFQLYFDFSGYSDMAIGLSRMFGVTLPINFNSPYKAGSIIDFWRRWHMTLSRFLRDYLYIPLGGNRRGWPRTYFNLLVTMLLGGLWHGAAWTFVVWGGIHGLLLTTNYAWRVFMRFLNMNLPKFLRRVLHFLSIVLTFYLVVLAWVFFRSENIHTALHLIQCMMGKSGLILPISWMGTLGSLLPQGVSFGRPDEFVGPLPLSWLPWMFGIVWILPNTHEFMARFRPTLDVSNQSVGRLNWAPLAGWAVFFGVISAISVTKISKLSEFLYFQF